MLQMVSSHVPYVVQEGRRRLCWSWRTPPFVLVGRSAFFWQSAFDRQKTIFAMIHYRKRHHAFLGSLPFLAMLQMVAAMLQMDSSQTSCRKDTAVCVGRPFLAVCLFIRLSGRGHLVVLVTATPFANAFTSSNLWTFPGRVRRGHAADARDVYVLFTVGMVPLPRHGRHQLQLHPFCAGRGPQAALREGPDHVVLSAREGGWRPVRRQRHLLRRNPALRRPGHNPPGAPNCHGPNDVECPIFLPASKTDPAALTTTESWGWVCNDDRNLPCPYHAMVDQFVLLKERIGDAHGKLPEGLPAFPQFSGEAVAKEWVVVAWKHWQCDLAPSYLHLRESEPLVGIPSECRAPAILRTTVLR